MSSTPLPPAVKLPKHILVLTPGFPRDEQDENCIPALQEYLRAFNAAYPEVRISVVAFHYPFAPGRYAWRGIDIFALAGGNRFLQRPLLWFRAVRRSLACHRSEAVDVVHSFWLGECAAVGALVASRTGAAHYSTLMGQEMRTRNAYSSLLRSGPTRFVALSEPQSEDFRRQTGRPPDALIHWGVDDPGAGFPADRDIDLLGVGSLIAVKNFPLFLRAAAAAVRRRPSLRCVIAGDGQERPRIAAMIEELGLKNNVTLTGMIPRNDVLALMRRSRILVHPSLYEGFGYVFAEALASGTHVVSFAVGCARPHAHWRVAADEGEFHACVESALAAALEHVPANLFPMEETVRRYAGLYGAGKDGGR